MNFEAFDTKFSLGDYIAETVRRIKYYFGVAGKIRIFFALFATFSLLFYFGISVGFIVYGALDYSRTNSRDALIVALIFTVIFIVGIALSLQAVTSLARAALRMQKFATDNKFEYMPYVPLRDNQGFAFSAQTRSLARNGSTGKVGGRNFWLFEYRFMSGTGRRPYPNIFTVLMLQVEKSLPNTVVINKKGRLKVLWPRGDMQKTELWPELGRVVTVYGETQEVNSGIGGMFNQQKMERLLEIYPKAEVQAWGSTLTFFIPGKQQPGSKLAQELFEFSQKL